MKLPDLWERLSLREPTCAAGWILSSQSSAWSWHRPSPWAAGSDESSALACLQTLGPSLPSRSAKPPPLASTHPRHVTTGQTDAFQYKTGLLIFTAKQKVTDFFSGVRKMWNNHQWLDEFGDFFAKKHKIQSCKLKYFQYKLPTKEISLSFNWNYLNFIN